ncbi:MAG: DUF5808 domain-containing protein [Sinimarinibacterium flocculans]|uniref:DUF5808 domain-containing protein n=1 Tax=Sinimarinibacterium flocculans TaxID=985250 RepID=UPI003C49622C
MRATVAADPVKERIVTPQQIQQAEWENPANWSTRGPLGVYFSKADPRIWVPKTRPGLGWTVNLAHPAGVAWMFGLLLLPTVVLIGVLAFACPCAGAA